MRNPDKTGAFISLGVAAAAAILIFVPGWTGMDGMKGGYALSFVSFAAAVSAAVVAWFMWRRAVQVERIINGQDLLAHWTYSPAEWQAYAGAEQSEQIQENKGLWLLTSAICLVVGAAFWLVNPEAGFIVFLVMLGLILLLALAAFIFPRLQRRQRMGAPGDAWLTPSAVFFDGVLVRLHSLESSMDKVEFRPAQSGAPACLDFSSTQLVATGIRPYSLRVPVPAGHEAEAMALLDKFTAPPRRRRSK